MPRMYDDTGRTTSMPAARDDMYEAERLVGEAWAELMAKGYLPHEAALCLVECVVAHRCETALTNSLTAYRAEKGK